MDLVGFVPHAAGQNLAVEALADPSQFDDGAGLATLPMPSHLPRPETLFRRRLNQTPSA